MPPTEKTLVEANDDRARAAHQPKRRPAKVSGLLRERANRRRRLQLAGVLVASLAAVGVTAAVFTAGPGPGSLNTILHQHPNLQIFVNGNQVELPINIGIDPNLWHDHSMDEYQEMSSMSPIHTHDSSGVIHLEMGKWHPCTLGDFFNVWGQPFDRDRVLSYVGPVTMTVDGHPSEAYRDLVLQDGLQIVIRSG